MTPIRRAADVAFEIPATVKLFAHYVEPYRRGGPRSKREGGYWVPAYQIGDLPVVVLSAPGVEFDQNDAEDFAYSFVDEIRATARRRGGPRS